MGKILLFRICLSIRDVSGRFRADDDFSSDRDMLEIRCP
jgi:hypothetical protein